MAPDSSERTALKEYAGAYSGTVVQTKFLDVEYDSVHLMLTALPAVFYGFTVDFPFRRCAVFKYIYGLEGVRVLVDSVGLGKVCLLLVGQIIRAGNKQRCVAV